MRDKNETGGTRLPTGSPLPHHQPRAEAGGHGEGNACPDRPNLIDVLAGLSSLDPKDAFPEDIDDTLPPVNEVDL